VSIPSNQPIKKRSQKDFWRREYIRLLTKPIEAWTDLTPEHVDELDRIDDLIQAGYLRGDVIRDSNGEAKASVTQGPTLAGRIVAEEQQEKLDRKSVRGQIKSGAGIAIGWVAGILSALVIQYLAK